MNQGWIKLHRKVQKHWIFKNSEYLKAWITILMEVNHSKGKFLCNGRLLYCDKGESLNSLETWGKLFGNWSTKRVRTFFNLLKKEQMIVTESVTVSTRLRVCNYSDYQVEGQPEGIAEGNQREQQRATGGHTNKNGKKDKKDKNEKKPSSQALQLAEYLYFKILQNNPTHKKPNMNAWAKHVDLLMRVDKKTPEMIKEIIDFAQSDNFWCSNILSTSKLRIKFDTLVMKSNTNGNQQEIIPPERMEWKG